MENVDFYQYQESIALIYRLNMALIHQKRIFVELKQ